MTEEKLKEVISLNEEINNFLKECKAKMRSYKLPVILSEYYVQLNEANDAIKEVVNELETLYNEMR